MSARLLATFLALLLGVGLVLQTRHALRVAAASRDLEIVERRTAAALAAGRVPQILVRDNLRKLDRVEAAMPAEVTVRMARGSQYLISGRPHAALRGYREALELEERAEVWLNVARAHGELGEAEAVHEAIAHALILDPNLYPEAQGIVVSVGGRR